MLLTSYTQLCFISAIIAHLQDDRTYAFGCTNGQGENENYFFRLTGVYEYLQCTNTYGNYSIYTIVHQFGLAKMAPFDYGPSFV